MFTIKNTSSKIIHIGKTVLMPDQTMEAPEHIAKLPSIQAFAKRKMLEITAIAQPANDTVQPDAGTGEKAPEGDANGEESGEDTAEDKAPEAPKGTRRTTRKAAESKE